MLSIHLSVSKNNAQFKVYAIVHSQQACLLNNSASPLVVQIASSALAHVHGTLVMVQVVCQDKKIVVAEGKTRRELLLGSIVQEKHTDDEQERQVRPLHCQSDYPTACIYGFTSCVFHVQATVWCPTSTKGPDWLIYMSLCSLSYSLNTTIGDAFIAQVIGQALLLSGSMMHGFEAYKSFCVRAQAACMCRMCRCACLLDGH